MLQASKEDGVRVLKKKTTTPHKTKYALNGSMQTNSSAKEITEKAQGILEMIRWGFLINNNSELN